MDNESLPQELQNVLSRVKLKEPSPELMVNYLSGVNAKIDRGTSGPSFGFPQVSVLLLLGIAFTFGIVYLLALNPKKEAVGPMIASQAQSEPAQKAETTAQTLEVVSAQLSLEDQLTLLEAMGEESTNETIDLFGNEELLDEAALLDDVEFSDFGAVQTPAAI